MVMLLVLSGRRTESRLEMRKTSNNTQHGDQRLCPLGVTESSGLLLYNRTYFAQPHQIFPVLNLSSMNLPTHLNPSWVEAIALRGFAERPCPCSFDQNPIQQERKWRKVQSGDSPNITGALQKRADVLTDLLMQDPITVRIPTGINRFKKVKRLILSTCRYGAGTGVCMYV